MTKTHYVKTRSFLKVGLFILLTLCAGRALAFEGDHTPEVKDQHQQRLTVKGTVKDSYNDPVPGATVVVKGTTNATITNADGNYTLNNVPTDATLVYSFMGMQPAEVAVNLQTVIDVVLQEDAKALDEVVVVAFGTQKKESMISSIQTVNPKSLKVPSSNLTTALAGRMSGVIAYQRSGEPGKDNADFFIRGVTTFGYKKDPLILIDGAESTTTELSRLQPDDISAFSILKDATATALYGARGANGVIQVSTKEGHEGPIKVSVRFENSFSGNTQDIKLADPITFMRMANEATLTRNPDRPLPYSYEKIDNTVAGKNPYVYPANDWRKLLIKDVANSQRVNMNLSGGGGIGRYYIAASYSRDGGNLKVDNKNNFNNNINLQTYQIRSNINLELTKTTKASIRLSGSFDDYRGPLGGYDDWGNRISGGEAMYRRIMVANPVQFPAYYPSSIQPDTKHILFGNASRSAGGKSADYINPYAEMVRGYMDYSKSQLDAQAEVKQDLNFITKGLNFRAMFNTSRYSYFDVERKYNPYYYGVRSYDKKQDEYTIMLLNEDGNPTEYLDYSEGKDKDINSTVYIEAALSYNRVFGMNDVSGMLVFQRREQIYANKGTLQKSLPYRNQGLSGRFTYAYDGRYLAEFNFGYNGSERFYKSKRYGFFPAVGVGWIVSNEKFFEPLSRVVSKFKLKATYGLVGNDAIGDENDRFFYLSDMNMNDEWKGYQFGENFGYGRDGVTINRYDNRTISWEKSYKANYGFELGLFNEFDIQFDFFTERRKNILMDRTSIPPSMGLSSTVRANVGEAKASGVDFSIDYNKMFKNGYWIQARGNFTYAHSEFVKYEEPAYNEKYRLHIGQSLKQEYGLIAERLFIDEYDVLNSPRQNYGEYGPGDIKYYDTNGDGQITDDDMVPLGHPTVPEIVYGFGFSIGNNRFDFSTFFQGSARSSFWIDGDKTSPFQNDVPLIRAYADDHWSEDNRDIYALWPRLSPTLVKNNTGVRNSWFMRNGAFLRLKTVEVGYKVPEKLLRKLRVESLRLYASGNNLLMFSGFDLWDVEMGGNGLGYPIQRVVNLGFQINF
ncbi:TonB-dependent receptor [Bacteroides sp. 51]|uniref:SusC/RagA family TonB-linked outer membrane protein n=1 Tax=Bacteroides sp. 51 TaxID=2302938 RepID=UPI0013D69F00|nr:TonB-dependent receptor [Bacteroides sp. 51]NDV83110.1 TonB-dependent receptor [Bacteroides sp. 51]